MRYLCCCNHGNVRSACLARELKDKGHEAIAIGLMPRVSENRDRSTIDMLCLWADKIIDMSDGYGTRLSEQHKVTRLNIGEDVWGNPFHPALREIIRARMENL